MFSPSCDELLPRTPGTGSPDRIGSDDGTGPEQTHRPVPRQCLQVDGAMSCTASSMHRDHLERKQFPIGSFS